MDLASYIRELILLNECVILPGFGGFETYYCAAQYDNKLKCMLPPTKRIQFRSDFLTGGGVLEEHLCKHLKIKSEQAHILVSEYVQDLNNRIETNREAIIGGVGLFTKGLGSSLSFSPFEEENYLAESFGLEALPYNELEVMQGQQSKRELKLQTRSSTFLFVTIGVVVISILMALTVFLSSKFELYLFNIGDKKTDNDLIVIGNRYDSDSTFQKVNSTLTEATDLKKALLYTENASSKSIEPSEEFYLVAGSFKALKNAEMTQRELLEEGYVPEIIENQGYFRVTIGYFNNKQNALRELQRMRRQLDRSVWLLMLNN